MAIVSRQQLEIIADLLLVALLVTFEMEKISLSNLISYHRNKSQHIQPYSATS